MKKAGFLALLLILPLIAVYPGSGFADEMAGMDPVEEPAPEGPTPAQEQEFVALGEMVQDIKAMYDRIQGWPPAFGIDETTFANTKDSTSTRILEFQTAAALMVFAYARATDDAGREQASASVRLSHQGAMSAHQEFMDFIAFGGGFLQSGVEQVIPLPDECPLPEIDILGGCSGQV